jgi:hypothetical protein
MVDEPERPAESTMARLDDQQGWYDRKSSQAQKAYKRVKVGQLAVGAAVPVVAGLSAPAAVTATLAALVVLAEGIQQLNQWQTNWVLYRSTAEALKHEKYLYQASAGPYTGTDRDVVLAERVEGLTSREHLKWTEARDSDLRDQTATSKRH